MQDCTIVCSVQIDTQDSAYLQHSTTFAALYTGVQRVSIKLLALLLRTDQPVLHA